MKIVVGNTNVRKWTQTLIPLVETHINTLPDTPPPPMRALFHIHSTSHTLFQLHIPYHPLPLVEYTLIVLVVIVDIVSIYFVT